jgi:serine/threonine-protein kinase HipA
MGDRDELEVWLGGVYAGRLHRRDADVDFSYDRSYRAARTPALSVSMPKSQPSYGGKIAGRWIDNLLPDNDEVRQRWAGHFGEARADAFNLLRHMGADCAGAVQILPLNTTPDTDAGSERVDEDMIEKRLRELRRDPAEWNFADHGGRWSLGGAQGKFALAQRPDGSWETPTGRAASTHIFKIGVTAFQNGDVVEYTTMRAAEILGIPVVRTTLRRFGNQTVMISQRFDRHVDENGLVHRLHQEDLCQALGVSRALKYESDGGPSAASISDLMRAAVDPRDLPASRKLFAQALVYNWLVAGTDAHAKNYALLHFGSRIRLAPLYDLAGSALVYEPDQVQYHAKLAMKMGGRYKIRDIEERHVARAAESLGVDPNWMRDIADQYAERFPGAIAQAIDESDGLVRQELATKMKKYVRQRIGHVREVLPPSPPQGPVSAPLPPTPIVGVPAAGGSGDTWVSEHRRSGRIIKGYWRKHPGR